MPGAKTRTKPGLTLVELIAVIGITSVLMFAVSAALVDGQRNWSRICARVFGGPTVDGLIASKAFEASVRKSVASRYEGDGSYVRLYYYKDPLVSTVVDGYVQFYLAEDKLMADYGPVVNGIAEAATATMKLADNVEGCTFAKQGAAVVMNLRLDDGRVAMTLSCSAIQNNM